LKPLTPGLKVGCFSEGRRGLQLVCQNRQQQQFFVVHSKGVTTAQRKKKRKSTARNEKAPTVIGNGAGGMLACCGLESNFAPMFIETLNRRLMPFCALSVVLRPLRHNRPRRHDAGILLKVAYRFSNLSTKTIVLAISRMWSLYLWVLATSFMP
jgi:hypothetical protein